MPTFMEIFFKETVSQLKFTKVITKTIRKVIITINLCTKKVTLFLRIMHILLLS